MGLIDTPVAELAGDGLEGVPGLEQNAEAAIEAPGADNWAKSIKGHKTEIKKDNVMTERRHILTIALLAILK